MRILTCDASSPRGPSPSEETRKELEWIIDVYYGRYGYGLWATIERSSGEMIGRCGLLPWKVVPSASSNLELTGPHGDPGDDDRYEVEIAYLLAKERWGQGLATEVTRAIVDLALRTLDVPRLICLVDPENHASMKVARTRGSPKRATCRSTTTCSPRQLDTGTLGAFACEERRGTARCGLAA